MKLDFIFDCNSGKFHEFYVHFIVARLWLQQIHDQSAVDDLFLRWHHNPVLVWIVAPVTSSTDSGDPLSFTSNFCNNIASATVDSMSANWSPTHFLGPPPKGKKAKSEMI